HAVVAADAVDQFPDRQRLVAGGLELGLDDEALAALALLRPRWPVRRPDLGAAVSFRELRAPLAQQFLQRLHAGSDAKRHRLRRWAVALLAPRRGEVGNLVAVVRRVADDRLAGIAVAVTQRLGELGVELARRHRRLADIAGLRCFAESLLGRAPRLVGVGEIGAAVERIIRRRLEPGLRADACGSLLDAGIEQLFERR